jgi:protein ImuB
MFFACIFVPDFPVEAILRSEPELRSRAVAVLDGKAPLKKVFAQNENARRAGVEAGMAKLEVEACSDIVLRDRSRLQEDAAHAALLDWAQSFSPRVEDIACDTILIDLAGLEPLFGPLPKIASDLARCVSDLGLESNVAVAADPDAAVIAARGFSGITLIPHGKEAEQLGELPVEVLFAGGCGFQEAEQSLETFHRWGIHKLRELANLPEVALSERLGQQGVWLQKLARGATVRTLTPVEPLLTFEEAVELEYPLVLLEPLAFLLGRLLEQLCTRLSMHALATQELRLRFELDSSCPEEETESRLNESSESVQTFERILRLPVPLLDAKVFLKLLQLDLNAHPPGAPILKIHLRAEPVRPRAAQGGLFLPPSPEPEKLELTLARIAGIVGEEKLGSLELLDTYRAEGFRMQRFVPNSKDNLKNKLDDYDKDESAVTALRIFRPTVPAIVTLRDGSPTHIACPKRKGKDKEIQGQILWAAGPWRSSGDWWEQEAWSRDEWDIAVQTETEITLFRLVRDLLAGRWFVEGAYD